MRILLVEDDAVLARTMAQGLESAGHRVELARTVEEAQHWWAVQAFDAVLLDLGLPDGDGSELLRRLRLIAPATGSAIVTLPDPSTPVLIVTARDQVHQRIAGLDQGADDYLTKPFDVDELDARLRALLRRSAGRASPTIRYGEIEADPAARTVRLSGQLIDMSPREFSVLLVLLEARGRVLSRPQIEEHLYSWGDTVESNAVEVYVHHLRKKLGQKIIVTMRGVGYFMPQEQE